jgi:hypothetical protein
MKNKNIYIIVAVVVVIGALVILNKQNNASPIPESTANQKTTAEGKSAPNTKSTNVGVKSIQTTKTVQKQSTVSGTTVVNSAPNLPNLDFIDKRISLKLKDYPDVRITIEKIAFGRRGSIISPKCNGVPNADFGIYLYPDENTCINDFKVDGAPGGIVAFHILIDNKGQLGFGGSSNIFKLHYLRTDSSGQLVHKFASPIIDLSSYYLNPYTSKEVVFSYMVPEDQLLYDFVSGYKAPDFGNKSLNVYEFSSNGFLVDFASKNIKMVK